MNGKRMPWAKWPCDQSGDNALLSLFAHGLLAALVSRCDQQSGRIPTAGLSPSEVLVRQFFVPKEQRRWIAGVVDELVKMKRLRVDEDAIVVLEIQNYFGDHSEKNRRDSKRSERARAGAARLGEDWRDSSGIEGAPKSSESLDPDLQDREGEGDIEKISPLTPLAGGMNNGGGFDELARRVGKAYKDRFERDANDAWFGFSANHAQIHQVAAYIASQTDRDVAIREVFDGFFADEWARSHRWPWKALAKDPGRYRGSTKQAAFDERRAELDRIGERLTNAIRSGRNEEIRRLQEEQDALTKRIYGTDRRAAS